MKKGLFVSGLIVVFCTVVSFRLIEIRKIRQKQKSVFSLKTRDALICRALKEETEPDNIPALTGWGHYHWKISTKSDSVQFYFDQGINMYYAFHTLESRASFSKAIRFDSTSAMAWYGRALALGPTINYGNGFRASVDAANAAAKSKQFAAGCTEMEKGLIAAIGVRYSADSTSDLKALQLKYAAAMEKLAIRYPQNADVVTLYADALMLEHPWDMYDHALNPRPWTPEIRRTLEKALLLKPQHPGANHFMIHTMEGSKHPEQALKNAEMLADLMPDVAHITHMPSHIYIRTGNYSKGISSNDKALKGYNAYYRMYQPVINDAGLYQVHAIHLKFDCALAAGNYATAKQAADTLQVLITPDFLSTPGAFGSAIQYIYVSKLFAMIRFGKWEAILQVPPADSLAYATVLLHFARGIALSHLNRIPEAEKELRLLQESMQTKDLKIPYDPFSSAYDASLIAENILKGVLEEQGNQDAKAVLSFRKAAAAEDSLIYDEPRDWLLPARQYLGDLYLKMELYPLAIKVFNQDLVINPQNGWSLTGLQTAYRVLQDQKSLKKIQKELALAWQIKDVQVDRSVY